MIGERSMIIRTSFLNSANTEMSFPTQCAFKRRLCDSDLQQTLVFLIPPLTKVNMPHSATMQYSMTKYFWVVVIGNYVIPKDAILVSSMAAMHMNPEFYDEPEVFNPDRFMKNTQRMSRAANCKPQERDHFGFGWGKRICPGIHLVGACNKRCSELLNQNHCRPKSRFSMSTCGCSPGSLLSHNWMNLEIQFSLI